MPNLERTRQDNRHIRRPCASTMTADVVTHACTHYEIRSTATLQAAHHKQHGPVQGVAVGKYYCSRRPRSYPMRCAVAAGSWSPHTGGCDRVYRLRWDTAVAADRRAYSLVGGGSSFGGFHCKLWATDRTVFVVIVLNFCINYIWTLCRRRAPGRKERRGWFSPFPSSRKA